MLFVIAIGYVGSIHIKKMAEASEEMFNERLVPVKELMAMRGNYRSLGSSSLEHLMATDEKRKEELEETINDFLRDNKQILSDYEKTQPTGEIQEVFEELKNINDEYEIIMAEIIDINNKDGQEAAYEFAGKNFTEVRVAVGEFADKLVDLNVEAAEKNNQTNQQNKQSASVIMNILTVSAIVRGIGISYIIMILITKPLKEMKELIEEAEQGNFSKRGTYQSTDEIGLLMASFNQMLEGLKNLISEVSQKSEHVAASSEELSASAEMTSKATDHITNTIQELVAGTDRQLTSVSSTVEVMNDMADEINQTTLTSQHIADASVVTSEKAQEGYETIENAIVQMNSINKTVHGLGEMIKNLDERSREISSTTKVINDVSNQTNLLALNAAIEAARAGDYGSGFAVVAGEVKQLAERTTESSQEISSLIESIQNETQLAVSSMQKVSTEMTEGIEKVNNAGITFEQISQGIDDVSRNLLEVSAAAQQVSASTDHIKQSIGVVSEVVDITVTSTEEVSASTEEQLASMQEIALTSVELAKIAEELQTLISKFKI